MKGSTNNKIVNLSTKWVSQWGMVGYAHKKYKNNIFLMRQNWIHQKDSKNCTLVSGQLIALDSHRHGSSSEWILLWQSGPVENNLRAQYMQWAVTATIILFYFIIIIIIIIILQNKKIHCAMDLKTLEHLQQSCKAFFGPPNVIVHAPASTLNAQVL